MPASAIEPSRQAASFKSGHFRLTCRAVANTCRRGDLRLRSIAIFLFAKSIAYDREFANRLESMNAARSGEVLKYFPASGISQSFQNPSVLVHRTLGNSRGEGRLTPPPIGKAKKGNKWIQF
jgi:hypothetical protein